VARQPAPPAREGRRNLRLRLERRAGRCAGSRRRRHQLAPENSARRAMIARAAMLTSRVITNRASPVAISTFTDRPLDSGNLAAMLAAIVWCWPGWRRKNETRYPGDRIIRTAIV